MLAERGELLPPDVPLDGGRHGEGQVGEPGANGGQLFQDRPQLGVVAGQSVIDVAGHDGPLPVEHPTIQPSGLVPTCCAMSR